MYKIIDTQGGGMMLNDIFKTKQDVIDRLAGYHDSDFEGEKADGTPYKHIFELLDELETEAERLDWLLEWGQWELEELTKEMSDYIEVLDQNIGFETSKDLIEDWTADYREGFVDGLKRAKELTNNKN